MCAISHAHAAAAGLPVGLMLVARNGQDRRLFEIAAGDRAAVCRVRALAPANML